MNTISTACETWQAMGTSVTAHVDGSADLVARARRRVSSLEQRWSRFVPTSDVGRCNATRGIPVSVHADTRLLVRQAIRAHELTDGKYDPTIHDALVSAGYDRSFGSLVDTRSIRPRCSEPVPGPAGIAVDDAAGTITLPLYGGFDPGGIGKGLAADLVVEDLLAHGAQGAFVSIGGDIRTAGSCNGKDAWLVEVNEPTVASSPIAALALKDGAAATSTDQKRTWGRGASRSHHIIDPLTGLPALTSAALVSVVAADAWWAEVLATQLILTPSDEWSQVIGDDAALAVDHQGRLHHIGRIEEFLR